MTTVSNKKIKQMQAVRDGVYSLIEKYKTFQDYEQGEAMDGDAVDVFIELVANITNEHEAND